MSIDLEKKQVRVSWRYPFPQKTVFQAIADGKLLITCGGRMHEFKHDFQVGGQFAFSWAPGEVCQGTYLEIVPFERLKWTWNEKSKTEPVSEVTVVLTTKGAFTHIDLLHEKAGSVDSAHNYHQGWTEVLGLFLDELNGTTLHLAYDFNASPEQLFKALSMGALFRSVAVTVNVDAKLGLNAGEPLTKSGQIDFREGGRYDYPIGKNDFARGQFSRIVPNEMIRFSWSTLDSGLEIKDTEVSLFLEKLESNKTRLHLVHDGLPTRQVSDSHAKGWGSALESMSHNLVQ